MVEKICLICGCDISHMAPQARYCTERECRNARSRNAYQGRFYEKVCPDCGCEFEGTARRKVCEACRKVRAKNKTWKTMMQNVVCGRCGVLQYTHEVFVTATNAEKQILCGECKLLSNSIRAQNQKGELNTNWKNGGSTFEAKCRKRSSERREEVRLLRSIRMKTNNPMWSQETKDKASTARKSRIASGALVYARGPSHHLWKGNRRASFVIRSRLNGWVQQVLVRDGFRCCDCGAKRNLEVHHLRPFKDIVDGCCLDKGVDLTTVDVSGSAFQDFVECVNGAHRLEDGITLCKVCHSKWDSKRHIG